MTGQERHERRLHAARVVCTRGLAPGAAAAHGGEEVRARRQEVEDLVRVRVRVRGEDLVRVRVRVRVRGLGLGLGFEQV